MKPFQTNLRSSIRLVLCLAALPTAHAQITGSWLPETGGSWGTAANWSSNPDIPGTTLSGGDSASLIADLTAAATINLDGARRLGSLTIGDPDSSHAYTIAAGTGGSLIFDTGSAATATLTHTSNIGANNINAPITLTSNLRVIELGTTAVGRNFTGAISGAGSLTFDNDDGSENLDPIVAVGQFALNVASTFSGGLTIKDVRAATNNATGYGTGTVTVLPGGGAWVNGALTVANNFNLSGQGWLEPSGYLSCIRMATNSVLNGTITVVGTPGDSEGTSPDASILPLATTAAATGTINGVVAGGDLLVGSFSAGNATWTANDILTLNATNTYGDTIVSALDLPTAGQTVLSIGGGTANTTATLGTGNVYLQGGDGGKTASLRIWRGGGYTLQQDIITTSVPVGEPPVTPKTAFIADVTGPGLATNGHSITVTEQIRLGGNANGASIHIDAGTAISAGQFFTGNAANNSTVVNQTGGVVNVSGEIRVAHWPTETSSWNLSGGTLNLTGLPTANPYFTSGTSEADTGKGTLYLGIDGQGMFNQTGGTVNAAAVVLDNRGNTGAGANMATGVDTYLLAGGALNLGSDVPNGDWGIRGNPSSSFEFAGGTLNLGTSLPITVPVAITGTGSVLDTKGYTATLSGPLSGTGVLQLADSSTSSGFVVLNLAAASTVGGFTGPVPFQKSGPGLLTITGSAARTGENLISEGGLRITGALAGDTQVEGATLWTGGTLNGALSLGVSTNSTIRYTGAPLQINGNLAFDGTSSNPVNPLGAGPLAAGTYPLLQYTGTLTGGLANLTIDSAATSGFRQSFGLTSTANAINLTVAGSNKDLVWKDGVWDINASTAWVDTATLPEKFFQLDNVTFDDTGVELDVELDGELRPNSITINADTNEYYLIDAPETPLGSIAGSAPILKRGAAKFRIEPPNPLWDGPVTIASGELEGAVANALGTGPVTLGHASTAPGDFSRITYQAGANTAPSVTVTPEALDARLVSRGATLIVPSILKRGPGRFTLGHETYTDTTARFTGITGGITVEQGTLAFSSRTTVAAGTAIILGNANTENVHTILEVPRSNAGDGGVLDAAITLGTLPAGSTSQAIIRYTGVVWNGNTSGGAPTVSGTIHLNGRKLFVENNANVSGADVNRLWNLPATISGTGDVHIRCGTNADGNHNGGARVRLMSTANSWTGDLYIETGMVQLGNGGGGAYNAIPDGAVVYMSGGSRIGVGSSGDGFLGLVGGAGSGAILPAIIDDNLSSTSNSFTITLTGSETYVFDGILRRTAGHTGLFNLTKSGSGTQVLNGASLYNGTTNITGGTLAIGSDTALGSGAVNLNNAGATLRAADANPRTLANAITYSTDFTLGSPDTGNLTFTGAVNVGGLPKVFNIQNAVTTFNGVISGSGTPDRTKNGPGTLVFGGANTYTGNTIINQGALLVTNTTGSGTGTTNVTVNATGTVGGSGTITGKVFTNGGSVAPGVNGVGVLTVGELNLDSTGSLAIQFDSSGTPAADQVVVTATCSLANATLALGDVAASPAPLPDGTKLPIIDPASPVTGKFAGLNDGDTVTAAGGQQFIVRYNDGGKVTLEAASGGDTPYVSWAKSFGLNPATNGAPGADPENDGIPNAVEFVIGGNPNTNSASLLPKGKVVGSTFVFTFTRSEASKAYQVWVDTSTNLTSWPLAGSYLIPTTATAGPPVTVADDGPANPDDITVTVPMGADTTKFGRLRVIIP